MQKPNEAKTFKYVDCFWQSPRNDGEIAQFCTLCGFILFGLPRKFYEFSRNDGVERRMNRNDDSTHLVIARLLQKVEAI